MKTKKTVSQHLFTRCQNYSALGFAMLAISLGSSVTVFANSSNSSAISRKECLTAVSEMTTLLQAMSINETELSSDAGHDYTRFDDGLVNQNYIDWATTITSKVVPLLLDCINQLK
jgi:hypothetical protein